MLTSEIIEFVYITLFLNDVAIIMGAMAYDLFRGNKKWYIYLKFGMKELKIGMLIIKLKMKKLQKNILMFLQKPIIKKILKLLLG